MSGKSPMLKACGLWEKRSAAGNTYMVGRLAGLRVVILMNKDRTGADDPTHHLFVAAADEVKRAPAGDDSTDRRRPRRTPTNAARRPNARAPAPADAPDTELNDSLDGLFP